MKNRIKSTVLIVLLAVGGLKSQQLADKKNKDFLTSSLSIDEGSVKLVEDTHKNIKLADTINIKTDSSSYKSNSGGGQTINYDTSRTTNVDYNADINQGKHMNKNRDRNRDLRRDLKRDKNRDFKRDKNRDRVRIEKNYNKFKIKIKIKS